MTCMLALISAQDFQECRQPVLAVRISLLSLSALCPECGLGLLVIAKRLLLFAKAGPRKGRKRKKIKNIRERERGSDGRTELKKKSETRMTASVLKQDPNI